MKSSFGKDRTGGVVEAMNYFERQNSHEYLSSRKVLAHATIPQNNIILTIHYRSMQPYTKYFFFLIFQGSKFT